MYFTKKPLKIVGKNIKAPFSDTLKNKGYLRNSK